MCAPVVIGALAAGTALQAYAGYRAARDEETAAAVGERQAKQAAGDERQRGQAEESQIRTEGSQFVGEQQAAMSSSGVDVASGGNLFKATRRSSGMEAVNARVESMRRAWALDVEAQQYGLAREAAKRRKIMAPLASVLGGIGEMGTYAAATKSRKPATAAGKGRRY